ncbi:hypothetical protein C8J57DRAFT_1277932 [Mycena rebaudengoi]|nr:hypothetical protein C8J57DRAFT_1277932 [Mycena rebaudengoi]
MHRNACIVWCLFLNFRARLRNTPAHQSVLEMPFMLVERSPSLSAHRSASCGVISREDAKHISYIAFTGPIAPS